MRYSIASISLVLFATASAAAQFNPRTATQPANQDSAVQPPQADPQLVSPKAIAADPVDRSQDEFVGKIPAVHKTVAFPPGEAQFKFDAAGLELGDDGYYSAPAGNGFFMWFPPTALGMPVSITCSVRGPVGGVRFGDLSWILNGGSEGGHVGFRFGPGATETTYQTNFINGDASLTMMRLVVPPGGALKECRLSGTFEMH